MFYFDNAASTKVFKEAAEAALNVMLNFYANPSSIHGFGLKSEEILNSCRKTLAEIFSKNKENFFFTHSATHSINTTLLGTAKKFKNSKNKIITSNVEHAATNNCLEFLKNSGFEVIKINPRNNNFYIEDFINAVDSNCFLVSLMHVNNENGLIFPIEEIAKKIKEKNEQILIHIDAAQSFLKIPLSLNNIDFCSFSGHKINAPKGIGVLYVKNISTLKPIMFGGGQEKNLCPGTQATALIKALEIAIKKNYNNRENLLNHYKTLKEILVENLKDCENIHFNFNNNCVPYIVNISVKNVSSQLLLQYLETEGFIVSSGAACSKNYKNTTISNLGFSKEIANSAIRISFGKDNTIKETLKLSKTIKLAPKKLLV